MKNLTKIFILLIVNIFTINLFAQSPEAFKYQAIARDASGNVIANQNVSFRISIIKTSATGTPVYVETHNLTTNNFGLANLNIGEGSPVSGNFSTIDWATDKYFIKVEMDATGGTSYQHIGTSQLLSVPYALYAKEAANISGGITETDPVFNAWDKSTGISITESQISDLGNYIETETDPAVAANFDFTGAVTGDLLQFNGTKWVKVTPNYLTNYTETDPVFNASAAHNITSVDILNWNNNWSTSGNIGTLSGTNFIGTLDSTALDFRTNNILKWRFNTKGGIEFLNTGSSIFIGVGAGINDNLYYHGNIFIGDSSGYHNIGGDMNIAIGYNSLNKGLSSYRNIALGQYALYNTSIGHSNSAIGYYTLYNNTTGSCNSTNGYRTLFYNTSGNGNVADGYYGLYLNTTGSYNAAIGYEAAYSNTTGNNNVSIGYLSNCNNSTGSNLIAIGTHSLFNTGNVSRLIAIGDSALYNNGLNIVNTYDATGNIAIGSRSMYSNTTGYQNTALGYTSLYKNTTGFNNIAIGYCASYSNTSGYKNSASGYRALYSNTTGKSNSAFGDFTLNSNITGSYNTAIGDQALTYNQYGHYNTAIGYNAGLGTYGFDMNSCTFLGASSYLTTSRTNVTLLGMGVADAQCTSNDQILLGNTAITQIRAQITGITAYSDARMKFNVKDDVKGLDFIMKLKPVTYNEDPTVLHKIWGTPDSLLKNIDHSQIKQQRFIGFLAQDVEQAAKESGFDFPGIDVPKNDKEVYSLRYVDFLMPMVKAIQEQQTTIENLQTINDNQQSTIDNQQKEIESLKSELQELRQLIIEKQKTNK